MSAAVIGWIVFAVLVIMGIWNLIHCGVHLSNFMLGENDGPLYSKFLCAESFFEALIAMSAAFYIFTIMAKF